MPDQKTMPAAITSQKSLCSLVALEACPCCGHEHIVIRYGKVGSRSNIYDPKAAGFVECARCGLRTGYAVHVSTAVKKWNRRPDLHE